MLLGAKVRFRIVYILRNRSLESKIETAILQLSREKPGMMRVLDTGDRRVGMHVFYYRKDRNQTLYTQIMDMYDFDACLGEAEAAQFERDEFLKALTVGDTLHIIDETELGASMQECVSILSDLAKRKINIAMYGNEERLTGDSSPYVLLSAQYVDALFAFMQAFRIERTRIGVRNAKGRVHFGRLENALPDNFKKAVFAWKRGEVSAGSAARLCEMPLSTFYKKAKEVL